MQLCGDIQACKGSHGRRDENLFDLVFSLLPHTGKKSALLSALQRVGQEAMAGQVAAEAGVPAVDKVYEAAAEEAAKKKR